MKLFGTLIISLLVFFNHTSDSFAQELVEVTFTVVLPNITPLEDTIYIQGNFNNWDPGPGQPPDSTDFPMVREQGMWSLTLEFPHQSRIRYRYTRGSEETIEKKSDSTDIQRLVTVHSEVEEIVRDTVATWADYVLPPQARNGYPVLSYSNNSPQTSIAVTWPTELPGESKIYYGINDVFENYQDVTEKVDMISEGDGLIHRVELNDLQPNTKYKYKVETVGVYESEELSFTTGAYEDEYTFAVMGDCRPSVSEGVLNGITNDYPRFILHTGDLANQGFLLRDWYEFLDNWYELTGIIPWMPVYGNHEYDQYLNKFFKLPKNNSADPDNFGHWYSFDYNNARFIALDVYRDLLPGTEQYNFLVERLNSIPGNIYHKFVYFHEPAFSSGIHPDNLIVKEHLVPLFEEFDVDIVFLGHEHMYDRTIHNGINYVTTGGAGSPLYFINYGRNPYSVYAETVYHYCRVKISGKLIKLEMVKFNGRIGNSFTIDKSFTEPKPRNFSIGQNYPNPFNPTTSINYSLPEATHVEISVYNSIGEEIETIVNSTKEAGNYTATFDGSKYASGVYLYIMKAGNFVSSRKLIILK